MQLSAPMLLQVAFVILGFVLLAKSAGFLVDGASSMARQRGVSDLVVGLTIIALGTSAPELVVSMLATVRGNGGIAIGNILGSNIANLCLVLGGAGIIVPIAVRKESVRREIPFLFAISILLMLILLVNVYPTLVSRVEALILLASLAGYLVYMLVRVKDSPAEVTTSAPRKASLSILLILGGLTGLIAGGEIIIRNAITMAAGMGVSQELIGLTVVAIGTSLPELATSIAAVLKGKPDIAVGNVVGSNIANTCLVLGSAAFVRPIVSEKLFAADSLVMVAAALILFIFMFTGKKHRLDRWEAWLLLLMYAGYISYAIHRG